MNKFLVSQEVKTNTERPVTLAPTDRLIDTYYNHGWEGVFGLLVVLTIGVIYNSIISTLSKIRIDKTSLTNILSKISMEDIKLSEEIDAILMELLIYSDCDRVLIGIFQNGTALGYLHNSFMTVEYEVAKEGINSIRKELKRVPIKKLNDEIKKGLELPNTFIKYKRNNKDIAYKCKEHLDNINVEEVWSRLLISEEDSAYAIVQLQWIKSVPCTECELYSEKVRDDKIDKVFNRLSSKLYKVLIKG